MRKAIFLFSFLFCLVNLSFAQSNEFTQVSQSKYFYIYSPQDASLLKLIHRLDIRSEYLLLESFTSGQEQLLNMLGAIVDAIFLEACDVLHMYIYSFKGNIKICQNQKELNKAFRKFSDQNLNGQAFYIHNTNSIYINIQNIRVEGLAYEIAQTIISHYFVVLPPVEIRKTLARDVGYQIRKLVK